MVLILGLISGVIKMYKKAPPGSALLRTGVGGSMVSFHGIIVIPVIHHLEVLDMTIKTYAINRKNEEALTTKDGKKVEIEAIFYLRINHTQRDVKEAAHSFGSEVLKDPGMVERNFGKKFEEVLLTIIYRSNLEDLLLNMDNLKMAILDTIGTDLNGFALDDLAIHHFKELKEETDVTQP